jgi:hypothetical protein
MTRRGGGADGPAPDADGDAARAAASAAGRPRSESRVGRDARHADLAGRRRYQIRVRGRLGQTFRSAFPDLRARAEGGDTVLTGVLADQAALYGVLAEAEALGLELLEVRRLPPRDEPQAPCSHM